MAYESNNSNCILFQSHNNKKDSNKKKELTDFDQILNSLNTNNNSNSNSNNNGDNNDNDNNDDNKVKNR